MKKLLLGVLLALAAPVMATDGNDWKKAGPLVIAALDVDATGHVTHAEPIGDNNLPQLQALVERTVGQWRFQPATVDGVPAKARTYARLTPEMREHDGKIELRLSYEGHGAGWIRVVRPYYPHEIVEADIVMGATVQADGTYGEIHVISARTSSGAPGKDFYKSVKMAMSQSRVLPELMNGYPVATHVRYPFHFNLDVGGLRPSSLRSMGVASDAPKENEQEPADASATFADGPITLDSPLKLVATK